jgi:hypothetical protein
MDNSQASVFLDKRSTTVHGSVFVTRDVQRDDALDLKFNFHLSILSCIFSNRFLRFGGNLKQPSNTQRLQYVYLCVFMCIYVYVFISGNDLGSHMT